MTRRLQGGMRRLFLILGGLLIPLVLTGCPGIIGPLVLITDLQLDPGQTGTLIVKVYSLRDFQVMQVGPLGALTFDPEVIRVLGLEGVDGFQVFAHSIDNTNGRVVFLAGYPGGGLTQGAVLKLEVKAVGPSGSSTAVEFTQIDLLADQDGNEFSGVKLHGGRVTIGSIGPEGP